MNQSSPTFVGFFVSRHLGLLLCNIAIMKRFLLIVILSNILLGQRITNSFFSELPELTKFPNNKFVLIQKSSYEESFGEFV